RCQCRYRMRGLSFRQIPLALNISFSFAYPVTLVYYCLRHLAFVLQKSNFVPLAFVNIVVLLVVTSRS
ncbi:TPA: hypothetical protein ACHKFV_004759, partial [Escherichia coli]